jgi:hypothetical protein
MTNPDFSTLTGPALVEAYNEMILTATDLGMPAEVWRTVKRFSGLDAGRTRCEKLHRAISQVREQDAAAPNEDRPRTSPKPEEMADTRAAATEVSADANRDLRPLHLVTATELKTNAAAHEVANPPDAPPAESGDNVSDISMSEMTGADLSEDDMAKKRKAAAKAARKTARANGSGETLASYTEAWNALVPRAVKAGIKGVKHHSSDFESYDKAKARVKWLEGAIAKA